MAVKSSVFASKSEKANYKKLARQWGSIYRLYHNLPFLLVFSWDNLVDPSTFPPKPISVTPREKDRLKKTSIDYTLCDDKDKPIVCIEFDGLQEGFNVGQTYHSRNTRNSGRQAFMELKLKVAHGSLFPFVVVGSEQFEALEADIKLTIVDGIIGKVISNIHAFQRIRKGATSEELGVTEDEFDHLSREEMQEVVQDWANDIEIDADIEHNPISKATALLFKELGSFDYESRAFSYPELNLKLPQSKILKAVWEAQKHGIIANVGGPHHLKATAKVSLPNFNTPGFNQFELVEDIALLLALRRFKRLLQLHLPKCKCDLSKRRPSLGELLVRERKKA